MNASKKNIQGIFDRSWHLIIPFFQRAYVWDEEEWERFLSDMYDVCQYKQEYFLGSIILKRESEEVRNCIVVDGQQRLTTLVLLFKVLLLKQNNIKNFDVIFKRIADNKPILIHNKNDRQSFESILNLDTLKEINNPINQIERCYNYFIDNLEENQISFLDLLKYIDFVSIELGTNENEKQIFDTINSLGVRLSDADSLKSTFFKNDEVALYEKYWQPIFEKNNDTIEYWHYTEKKDNKTLADVFLFTFLQLKTKDLEPKQRAGFGQINNLLKSYKTFVPTIKDKTLFFDEMERYANIFTKYINPNIAEERVITQIDRINLIIFEGGLLCVLPYVVFLLINLYDNEIELNKTLFILECYLMRRMVGIEKGALIAKDYAELFISRLITNKVLSADSLKTHLNGYKNAHLHYTPSDSEIKILLQRKNPTQAKAKLIFYLLDNKIRQDGIDGIKGEVLLAFSSYHIEHLMPIKWQKNWPQPIDDAVRNTTIKTLGNMTLTTQKLSNTLKESDWQTRLNGLGRAKGLLSYHHLALNKSLLNQKQWTDKDILKNNERLAKCICDAWRLN